MTTNDERTVADLVDLPDQLRWIEYLRSIDAPAEQIDDAIAPIQARSDRAHAALAVAERTHHDVIAYVLDRLRRHEGISADAVVKHAVRIYRADDEDRAIVAAVDDDKGIPNSHIDAAPDPQLRDLLLRTSAAQRAFEDLRLQHADTARAAAALYTEYRDVHAHDPHKASAAASIDTLQGVTALYTTIYDRLEQEADRRRPTATTSPNDHQADVVRMDETQRRSERGQLIVERMYRCPNGWALGARRGGPLHLADAQSWEIFAIRPDGLPIQPSTGFVDDAALARRVSELAAWPRSAETDHPSVDTWSSESRQHYIDTGEYLPAGHADRDVVDNAWESGDAATWSPDRDASESEPAVQSGRAPRMTYMQWTRSQGVDIGSTAQNEGYWRCPVRGCRVWAGPYDNVLAAKQIGMDHRFHEHDRPAARAAEQRRQARAEERRAAALTAQTDPGNQLTSGIGTDTTRSTPTGTERPSMAGEVLNLQQLLTELGAIAAGASDDLDDAQADLARAVADSRRVEAMTASLRALDVDQQTLSDVGALADTAILRQSAAQRRADAAEARAAQARLALHGVQSRHQLMAEAYAATPHAAARAFYQGGPGAEESRTSRFSDTGATT